MNTRNYKPGCYSCGDPCGDPCGPAGYDCGIDIAVNPFDPSFWNVTLCGKLHKIKLPPFSETDTKHSLDYSNATFNYFAEKHNETWTGSQLGSIITVGDLRDTRVDYDTDALCYELIYHKYGECGEGCKSIEDAWSTFSIDNKGALGPQIRYVRGANRYGCPYFLDVPTRPNEFWFQGWRQESQENGYYQPREVSKLPTDAKGDPYVMSEDPVTKEPVIGTLPWTCVLENIFGNLGLSVDGVWREIQGTPGFSAKFDQIAGNFTVNWSDWNDRAHTHRAGYGQVVGKLNWDVSFDVTNGTIKYVIHSIYFDRVTWTKDEGVTISSAPTMTLYGIPIPNGQRQQVGVPLTFGQQNVSQTLNTTIQCNQTVIVGPGQSVGPFDFLYIYVDWVGDDEGYMGVQFNSRLSGWKTC